MIENTEPPKKNWSWSLTRNEAVDYISTNIPKCAELEMDWMRCAERVGLQRTAKECRLVFEDVQECKTGRKMYLRLEAMATERRKQKRPEIKMLSDDAEKYADGFNTERS